MRIRRETDGCYGRYDACSLGSRIEGAGAAVDRSFIGSIGRWRLLPGEEWSRPQMSRGGNSATVSSYLIELADNRFAPGVYSYALRGRALVETWLILPVVICLSQRLSHACLSISFYMAKLRMAHYNSYSLFDGRSLLG